MAHLTLSLLGPFHALLDDKPITTFRSVKNQTLLAWLALESRRPVSRASVAGLCWPEEAEETARLNLRQALFQLRSVLHATDEDHEHNHLLITSQTLQFNFDSSYTIDIVEFNELFEACARHTHPSMDRCAECSSRLLQATTLYRGDFLQGMFVNDSESLEEWMLWRRQQFQQHQLLALHALASWFEQQADYKQAQAYAQRQLEIDSLKEDAYQQMMRILAWEGKRQEALVYFERCRQVLQDELGVAPSTTTQHLYEQIKGQTFPLQPALSSVAQPESPPANRHNLPTAPNRLVGRQPELQLVQQRLLEPDCRLITILGPGGVGKTRFALALAEKSRDWRLEIGEYPTNLQSPISNLLFPDGVWFTALAGVSNPLQLPQAMATSLGIRLEGHNTPRQELLDYLHRKQLLLVLDNYEHLMADAILVDEILHNSDAVKIVVTSRERLNFHKEWVYELYGLPFPPAQRGQQSITHESELSSAVQLFLDRAHRFSHFHATPVNLAAIQRICQLVEGYPLGIELAAALISMMSLPDIVQEIENGIDILATTMRDLPDRHRSLRAVFDSSWESLRPQERLVMARLAIFRGGFDWRAAQNVAQSSRLDLAGLLNKSMLSLTPTGRYEIHELLRQYAWARVEDRHEVQQCHARYFANFVETRKDQLRGAAQKQALSEFESEIENLRLAWRWATQQADSALLSQFYRGLARYFEAQGLYEEAESGFTNAASALKEDPSANTLVLSQILLQQGRFCRLRSRYEEAKRVLLHALALLDQQPQENSQEVKAQSAEALSNLGLISHFLGDNRSAQQQLEKGITISRALDRPELLAECLAFLALFTQYDGRPSEARQLFQESLAIRRSLHDLRGMALTINQLGFLYVNSADYTRAELMFQECLTIQRDLGDHLGVANTLNSLGAAAITSGDYRSAQRYHSESLTLYRQYNEQGGILRNLGNLGYVYNRLGEYEAALEISLQALAMDRVIGSPRSMVFTLRHLGESYLHLGDLPQARRHYHQALVMAQDIEEIPLVLLVLNAMAPLWIHDGQRIATVERLSFILNHPATEGKVLAQARRQLHEITEPLPPPEVASALERGKTMSLEEIVANVLSSSL